MTLTYGDRISLRKSSQKAQSHSSQHSSSISGLTSTTSRKFLPGPIASYTAAPPKLN